MISHKIDAKITELVADKNANLNPNERSRFTKGEMGILSKIRILEEHTPFRAFVIPVHKNDLDTFDSTEQQQ